MTSSTILEDSETIVKYYPTALQPICIVLTLENFVFVLETQFEENGVQNDNDEVTS